MIQHREPGNPQSSARDTSVVLRVSKISKQFPGVRALDGVSLTLRRGEVLAVIGENGAGKSTLMKILAGIEQPDSGTIAIDEHPVVIDSVQSALAHGIALIHQELNLCDNLDIAANIFLGREQHTGGWMNRRDMLREAERFLRMVGLNVPPDTLVARLSIGQQQMVEIARALSVDARILIMDEPTSSLSQQETETLFEVVKGLRRQGVSVIYISHRLGEVRELADRVTVLRDGRNAGELQRDEIDHDRMVRLMVGRDISQFYVRQSHTPGDPMLELEELVVPRNPRHKIRLQIRAGEIVGLAGLVGAGRSELLQCIFGIEPPLSGTIRVGGRVARIRHPLDAIRHGLALAPEDRKTAGVILEMTVQENITLPGLRAYCHPGGIRNLARERHDTETLIRRLRIKTPSPHQIVQLLSGGNQQKVVLAKWLALTPRVLLLDEPTRGIDVGAKREIYQLMENLAASGVAILFASSEMEEVLGMSDRVLVMHEGRIAGELPREKLSEENIMRLATGGSLLATESVGR
ncbi:MAG: sugar ABC transporter ATP-binding protein [Planctomycetota bacterium]|nr:MAG: sugar ABC transporter ATP-binding protein [Planctomycetota bacterium]